MTTHAIDVGPHGVITLDALVALAGNSDIASIWAVARKLAATLDNPNTSALELQKAVEIDPPLAIRVLRTANSAWYGMPNRVSSIRSAIVLMGFNKLRELALRSKVAECFAGGVAIGAYSRAGLWKHSVAVAICASTIFRKEFGLQGDEAYTAGLLHDLGILVEEQFMPGTFGQIAADCPDGKLEEEASALGYTHCELAGRLLRGWRLPEIIVGAVIHHHHPAGADPVGDKLIHALHIADLLCSHNGFGYDPVRGGTGESDVAVAGSVIGLSAKSLELIGQDVGNELGRMESDGVLFL